MNSAENLDQALSQLDGGLYPDLLISDYRLPGQENGVEVLKSLRQASGRELPCVLISGETDGEVSRLADAAGLTLLYKPLRPAKLRSLLSRLHRLAQQEAARHL